MTGPPHDSLQFPASSLFTLILVVMAFTAQVPQTPVPDQWAGSSVVILEDTLSLDFTPGKDRSYLDVKENCWYKVRPSAGPDIRALTFWDGEFVEQRPSINVTVFDSLGRKNRLGGSCFERQRSSEIPAVKYNLYFGKTGMFVTTVRIPSFDKVRYVLTSVHRPHMKPAFVGRYIMRNKFPTVHKTIFVSSPTGMERFWGISNGEGIAVDTSTTAGKKKITARITCADLAPLPLSNIMHSEQWLTSLEFRMPSKGTALNSWKDLGEYSMDVLESEQRPSTTLDSIAATLRADSCGILWAAYDYIKKHLRYYGSWEGSHGFVPRSCDDVVRNGYGDCKELSMVLCTLLKKRGVNAGLSLVSARAFFPEMNVSYPNMGVFNHMVVAMRTDSGFRYLDPTLNFVNAGNSYFRLVGRKTFVLGRGSSCVDSVVEASGFRNEARSMSHVVQCAGGSWLLKSEIWLYGLAGQQLEEALENRLNQTEAAVCADYLRSAFHVNATSPVVRLHSTDSVCVSFTCPFDECAIKVPHQGFVVTVPSLCAWQAPDPGAVDEGPVAYRYFTETDQWVVPGGKAMRTAFASLDAGSCRGSWKIKNDTLLRAFTSRPAMFPSANSPECRKFAGERSRFEKGSLWKE